MPTRLVRDRDRDERDPHRERAKARADAPHPCGGEVTRVSGSRASSQRKQLCPASQRTAASAQPPSGQPATANTGSARRITAVPASAGARRPGTGRGVDEAARLLHRRP